MFYTSKVLFVHIPRSGGTWLSKYAFEHFAASVDQHFLKHVSLELIYERIPSTRNLIPFTILRAPDEVVKSYFDLSHRSNTGPTATDGWNEEIQAVKALSYEDYVQSSFNPLSRSYYSQEIKEFPYENPLTTVIQWLHDMH